MENNTQKTELLTLSQANLRATKKEIAALASINSEKILGQMPADKAYVMFYKLELYCATMMSKLKPKALETFSGDEKRTIYGQEVSTYAPGKFTYDHNPAWKELQQKRKLLDEEIKQLEDRMKTAWKQIGTALVDTETGEVIPPARKHMGSATFRVR